MTANFFGFRNVGIHRHLPLRRHSVWDHGIYKTGMLSLSIIQDWKMDSGSEPGMTNFFARNDELFCPE